MSHALRLVLLTALTMLAFAANSVLNRAALADQLIGPAMFAMVRVISGALILAGLVWWQDRRLFDPARGFLEIHRRIGAVYSGVFICLYLA